MDDTGSIMDQESSPYILLSRGVLGHIPMYHRDTCVLSSSHPFCWHHCHACYFAQSFFMKHNFISSLFVIAGAIMAVHYTAVVCVNSGCQCLLALGPSETGKSTAIKVALSLAGEWHDDSRVISGSLLGLFPKQPILLVSVGSTQVGSTTLVNTL